MSSKAIKIILLLEDYKVSGIVIALQVESLCLKRFHNFAIYTIVKERGDRRCINTLFVDNHFNGD